MNAIFAKKTIKTRKSVGAILKSCRKRKEISLSQAELDTKVRHKYLLALEENNYKNMAPDVYNIGFIKRYCDYLKLDSKKYVERYKQDKEVKTQIRKSAGFNDPKEGVIKPGDPNKYKDDLKFVITPQLFITAAVVCIVVGILGYIWFQVKSFAAAPELALDNPTEQIAVSQDSIKITGNTDENALLWINEQAVGVDSDGNFTQDVILADGINEIQIKAQNKASKETIKSVKVLVINEEEE